MEVFGGSKDDYTSIQIHDEEYKNIVDMILKYPKEFIIPNKNIEKIAVDLEGYNSYLKELKERAVLESLIPSKEEVLKAETELQIITILQEVKFKFKRD